MVSFAVDTGVRAENVCGLKWDWEQRLPELGRSVFVIPASEFKSGRSHVVILNNRAQAVIDSMRNKHDTYVFTYRGDRVWEIGNNGWKQGRERAGMSQVRVHDLRHTFGMRLRYAGVSEEDRALLLGHASKSMPQHYATAIVERLVKQSNKVQRSARPMTILWGSMNSREIVAQKSRSTMLKSRAQEKGPERCSAKGLNVIRFSI
jgi:integrase